MSFFIIVSIPFLCLEFFYFIVFFRLLLLNILFLSLNISLLLLLLTFWNNWFLFFLLSTLQIILFYFFDDDNVLMLFIPPPTFGYWLMMFILPMTADGHLLTLYILAILILIFLFQVFTYLNGFIIIGPAAANLHILLWLLLCLDHLILLGLFELKVVLTGGIYLVTCENNSTILFRAAPTVGCFHYL